MFLACIACGGVLEIALVVTGLGSLLRWFRSRHKKTKCKCCQEHQLIPKQKRDE